MPGYSYIAKDGSGRRVEGVREAESPNVLVSMLRSQGLTVVKVGRPTKAKGYLKRTWSLMGQQRKRVSVGDLASLCRQLTTLIEAGIPILDALGIIAGQISNLTLRETIQQVTEDVKGGYDLSAAMAKHMKVFPDIFISMIQAGESSSELSTVMGQLSTHLESEDDLRKKVKSATSYPMFIIGFFFLSLIGVIFFLIPQFEKIFSDFDMELPLITRILMGTSNIALSYLPYELGVLAVGLFFLIRWARSLNGRYEIDRQKLKVPVFGEIIRKAVLARMSQTLATLLHSGVNVVEALDIAGKTSGNLVIAQTLDEVRMGVIGGATLAGQMRKRPIFPELMVGMISAGEESGALCPMLSKLAESYARDVDTEINGITSLLEPMILLAVGGVVMIVVLSIYLPIFKMSTQMK